MDAATVRVLCLPKEGNPEAGSGFVVGGGDFVATNHHVIACVAEGGRAEVINTQKALTAVPTMGADGHSLEWQRVPLGEGIGWAVASDELLPILDRLGIRYEVSLTRTGALAGLWHREPLLATLLGMLIVLTLGAMAFAATRRGRTLVKDGLTCAVSGTKSRPRPRPPPPPKPRRPVLRGVSGSYAGLSVPLGAQPVAVGRDPAMAQLVIPPGANRIGKRHALARLL